MKVAIYYRLFVLLLSLFCMCITAFSQDVTPPLPINDLNITTGISTAAQVKFDETSNISYTQLNAVTDHIFNISDFEAPIDSAKIIVTISGDFDNYDEFATVSIENTYLGDLYGDFYGFALDTFQIGIQNLEIWGQDGFVNVTLENSTGVGINIVGDDYHEVRLILYSSLMDTVFLWNAVSLTWTATGDDYNYGKADTYDIRYGYAPITKDNWKNQLVYKHSLKPSISGTRETLVVHNLVPYLRHYFAIKSCDADGNWSDISNVVNAVPDHGAPEMDLHFFQDAAFSQYLDLIILSSEKLKSLTMQIFDSDTTTLTEPVLLDETNFVYKMDYIFHHTDAVKFKMTGVDLAGNTGTNENQLNVYKILPSNNSTLSNMDKTLQLILNDGSVNKEHYITIAQNSENENIYQIGPKMKLEEPGTICFHYDNNSINGMIPLIKIKDENDEWIDLNICNDSQRRQVITEINYLNDIKIEWKDATQVQYEQIPADYKLQQNYPNPFNSLTHIRYQLPITDNMLSQHVNIKIFNLRGQEVRTLFNGEQNAGNYTIQWDGKNSIGEQVSSGIYICYFRAGEFQKSCKMLLIE